MCAARLCVLDHRLNDYHRQLDDAAVALDSRRGALPPAPGHGMRSDHRSTGRRSAWDGALSGAAGRAHQTLQRHPFRLRAQHGEWIRSGDTTPFYVPGFTTMRTQLGNELLLMRNTFIAAHQQILLAAVAENISRPSSSHRSSDGVIIWPSTRVDVWSISLGTVTAARSQAWHPVLDTYAQGVEAMRALDPQLTVRSWRYAANTHGIDAQTPPRPGIRHSAPTGVACSCRGIVPICVVRRDHPRVRWCAGLGLPTGTIRRRLLASDRYLPSSVSRLGASTASMCPIRCLRRDGGPRYLRTMSNSFAFGIALRSRKRRWRLQPGRVRGR